MNDKLPIGLSEEDRKWIDMRWNWLIAEFGSDLPKRAQVVLTEPEFFPDRYTFDVESAEVYLARVCKYMQVDRDLIQLEIYEEREDITFRENAVGTAGLYVEHNGVFQIWVELKQIEQPLSLVATLAHELSHVKLLGEKRITTDAKDHELLTDLLTVYFGMGIITANSVIAESNWRDGAYSGWNVARQGYMTMPMFGYALAHFAQLRSESKPQWSQYLRADVKASFRQSYALILNLAPVTGSKAMDETFLNDYASQKVVQRTASVDVEQLNDIPESDLQATCHYCGEPVRSAGTNCDECQASIDENSEELEEEYQRAQLTNVEKWLLRIVFLTIASLLGFLLIRSFFD